MMRYLRFAAVPLVLLVVLSMAISLGIMVLPGLGKMLYDKVFITLDPIVLFKYTGIQLFCIVYLALMTILLSFTENLICIRIANKIRLRYSRLLFRAKITFFTENDSGFLMKRIIEDSAAIAEGITKVLLLFSNMSIIGAVIFALYFIQPWLVALYVTLVAGSIVWMALWAVPIHHFNMNIGGGYSNLYSLFYEILKGIKEVKFQNLYPLLDKKIQANNYRVKNAILSNTILNCFMWQYGVFFNAIAYSFILIVGLKQIEAGDLSVGMLLGILSLISFFLDPIQTIYASITAVQSGIAAAERIHIIKAAPREGSGKMKLQSFASEIRFEKVSFSYHGENPILNGIDLVIPRGEKLAIVGKTGSGKTTIVQLLLRMFDGYTGRIAIDGVSLENFSTDSLREKILFVSQDVHLFRDTVRNNIDLGKRLSDAALTDIVRQVHLDDCIANLDNGINTVIGEDGTNFSGGERQRIGIARSLAFDPLVVVFDEMTSALDPHTEDMVVKKIMEHFRDKTVISISHRQAILQHSDRICVLNNGVIVEQGSLDELLRCNGEYCANFLI